MILAPAPWGFLSTIENEQGENTCSPTEMPLSFCKLSRTQPTVWGYSQIWKLHPSFKYLKSECQAPWHQISVQTPPILPMPSEAKTSIQTQSSPISSMKWPNPEPESHGSPRTVSENHRIKIVPEAACNPMKVPNFPTYPIWDFLYFFFFLLSLGPCSLWQVMLRDSLGSQKQSPLKSSVTTPENYLITQPPSISQEPVCSLSTELTWYPHNCAFQSAKWEGFSQKSTKEHWYILSA